MNLIFEALVGEDAIVHYFCSLYEWIDGRHTDVLYTPKEDLLPAIIKIQNVIDKPFIRRLIKYCKHIFGK